MVAVDIAATPWHVCEALVARATLALAHVSDAGAAPGFRLFWPSTSDGPATARADLAFATLPEGGHLVVGRHSECDVRLEHPSVALRHVLLRARRDASGALTLFGTDLGGELPMLVGPSGLPSRAFAVAGPTVLRLANGILVVLPVDAPSASAAADQSALRAVVDADPDQARPIPRALEDLAVRTMVSSMSRTTIRPFAAPLPVEIVPRDAGAAFARVAMRGPHGRVVVELSRAQLERVVLVGRYPRCRQGELSPFSGNVSRVHAGLLLEGDDLLVIDLASTNGIGSPRDHARAVRVRTRGTVALGPSDRLDIELVPA